jgi:hypothetical protein
MACERHCFVCSPITISDVHTHSRTRVRVVCQLDSRREVLKACVFACLLFNEHALCSPTIVSVIGKHVHLLIATVNNACPALRALDVG